MADIINLRQARKAKARADQTRQAEINRVKFGRTKAERKAEALEEERKARMIDGAHRDGQNIKTD
ncbi:hypothetical protein CAF53_09350 [Sphingobium sp. LB126]|uniref:DUF4169 family protein n=1 Tax=Sphingobium sp. LB126 TaxID=1983755 RepID=UPI000C20C6EB|nr:DUF4169 family protein [Sphingobium sp. LB126]PJG48421.1 hypothetical protein CAF53_09350 [Sphingobium sp. LB126]